MHLCPRVERGAQTSAVLVDGAVKFGPREEERGGLKAGSDHWGPKLEGVEEERGTYLYRFILKLAFCFFLLVLLFSNIM